MNVAFKTLGCKLNYSETSSISRDFENKGYNKVSFKKNADIYVINTCSVTQNADKEFKYLVNRAKKNNPKSKIIAIGCYAQLKPKEIGQIDGVDLVLGADKKFDVLNYIENNESHSCEINNVKSFQTSYSLGDRTRSFLKVQDGCDYKCTYCTIPLARGKSRSGKINEIIDNVKTLVDKGIKEIVLTGVNIGDYGIIHGDLKKESTFIDLLKNIDKVSGLERVRISSIEPNLLSNEIIHFVSESKKFMPHFHVPLQSGSDKILKLMKRRYLKNLYESRVEKIKSLIPDCSIGVDVIVGFPEETENDFNDTMSLIKEIEYGQAFSFKYSTRPGTPAAERDQVPEEVKTARLHQLQDLIKQQQKSIQDKMVGREVQVLFERTGRFDNQLVGKSEYLHAVNVTDPTISVGELKQVKIVKSNANSLSGSLSN